MAVGAERAEQEAERALSSASQTVEDLSQGTTPSRAQEAVEAARAAGRAAREAAVPRRKPSERSAVEAEARYSLVKEREGLFAKRLREVEESASARSA